MLMMSFSTLSLYCGCVNCGILEGLFDGITVKMEDMLEMMMGKSLDFLFGKTCLNMAGNYC